QLHFGVHLHLFADQHAARLKGSIPIQFEIRTIDFSLHRKAGFFIAPRILSDSAELNFKHNRTRYITDRKVAMKQEVLLIFLLPTARYKTERGMRSDVKEISGLQMIITDIPSGGNGIDISSKFHLHCAEVVTLRFDRDIKRAERARNIRTHHVTYFESK